MFTSKHWQAFELCDQNSKGIRTAAEIMGVSPEEVGRLMKDLRAKCPELFPMRTERAKFTKQNLARDGAKLYNIDDVKDTEIEQKF